MKAKFLIPLLSLGMLASCALQANVALADNVNTTYLVLSSVGRYSGEMEVKEKFPDLFLENVILFKGAPGTALPTSEQITATSGVSFLNWVSYDGLGAPSVYTEVPKEDGKILYAYFEGGKGGSVGPVDPGQEVTYTLTGAPEWITDDGCVIFAWVWGNGENGAWADCVYGEGTKPTSFSFTVAHEMTGCLLARCAAGTTLPDWDQKTDGPGKVYNQTNDLTLTSGQYNYTCPEWKGVK